MLDVAGLARIFPIVGAAVRDRSLTRAMPGNPAVRDRLPPLRGWLENHRARRRLWRCASLDPRFAKDIGLTESDIASECRAPFWVPVPRPRSPT
jgi:uncharacterized protein YjiS (DUF1127 family)